MACETTSVPMLYPSTNVGAGEPNAKVAIHRNAADRGRAAEQARMAAATRDAINRGELAINGLRNRDLQRLLYADVPADLQPKHRRSAAVSRKLRLPRLMD